MGRLKCDKCSQEFILEADFEKHRKSECTKTHICALCHKTFSSTQTLSNHIKLHTKELEFSCEICNKQFVSRSVLGNHMKTHDPAFKVPRFKCMHCPKVLTHPSNLKRHIRTAHFELSDKKTYDCTECDKSFRDPSALKHHLKTHMQVRPFPCTYCSKSFGSKTQLDNHLRIHTGEKPFLCNMCGRCFVTKGQLKSHKLNRHVGVKYQKCHLCPDCGQSFVKEFDLRVQMRKHTGERPFACTECGKTFRSERNLVNHRRIHTGDKPYRCETCSKCFASCAGLRQHFKCHATCRMQATEGAYCRHDKKSNRYGRVRLESIPELSMGQASSLHTLENFSFKTPPKNAHASPPIPMHLLFEVIWKQNTAGQPPENSHRRKAFPLQHVWSLLCDQRSTEIAQTEQTRGGQVPEVSSLSRLRPELCQRVRSSSADAQTHWRATLRLHRVWKDLSIREKLGQPQKDSHWGQAIQVRNMFEMLCLLRGAEAALQVPRHL